jgi:putative ABC transport system permease protein
MQSLNIKLIRDLRGMWSQVLTIALVVASGVGGYITALSAVDALDATRAGYYESSRFADLFTSVRRAPRSGLPALQSIPGVADVQATVERIVRIQVPRNRDPLMAQLVGMNARQARQINRVSVRDTVSGLARPSANSPGAALPDGALPAWVSEAFANAHQLRPGSRVSALINGKKRDLWVQALALSPEHVFAGAFGMPDVRGFGVFWVDEQALGAAFDMQGAYNRLSIRLVPHAQPEQVSLAVKSQLERYGARDVHTREHQSSNAMLENEIKEQHVLGTMLPLIFMAVAVFLINGVVSRLIATQREQIATLQALGYTNSAIALHYFEWVMVIQCLGFIFGLCAGYFLGQWLTALYAELFRFPALHYALPPDRVAMVLAFTLMTGLLGMLGALRRVMRLSPAEAMRPAAPARYRPGLWALMGLLRMPWQVRMVMRNLERHPWRSIFSGLGIATAVALVVLGNFFRDAIDSIVQTQFGRVMRADVQVALIEADNAHAARALTQLPAVLKVEPSRSVSAELAHGHFTQRIQMRGLEPDAQLQRVFNLQGQRITLPEQGVLLTDRLATRLKLRQGDSVQVQFLEGGVRHVELKLAGTVQETMGMNAYMTRRALNRALGEGDIASGFALAIERGREPEFLKATWDLPRLGMTFSKATLLRNMQEISARNIRIMSSIMTGFAIIIAVGVVYNNARINLSERAWELASLRVLGFTKTEAGWLLLGEMMVLLALALPLGMWLGYGLVLLMAELLKSDQFHFPVVIQSRTYAWAVLCVCLASAWSAAVVRRRIHTLDMVAVLKIRE